MIALAGSYGDVDRDGEIVDAASQLRLVEELLERARARRPGC